MQPYKQYEIVIEKSNLIKNSLLLRSFEKNKSLLYCDKEHIYYLLKSYANDNQGLVLSLYLILNDGIEKPHYLYNIKLATLINTKNIEYFFNWWDRIVLRLIDYETEEKKINIIIHLNEENIVKKFKQQYEPNLILQPNLFKKKKIVNKLYLSFLVNIILVFIIIIMFVHA